jgi:small subunit ribosomal protein S15
MLRKTYRRRVPRKKIEETIIELAKKGFTPSQIGLILRDEYKIYVKKDLNVKIGKILQKHGLQPQIPEDLMFLLKKAVKLHEHLQKHKKDKHSKRGLELLESKIRRLAKYYIREGKLPEGWKYSYEYARLIVQK